MAVQTLALEEGAVVGAGEEAGLLALLLVAPRPARRGRLVARRLPSLATERERDPVEQARVDGGEHVRLILGGVGAAGDEPEAVALDDPGVVPRPEDSEPARSAKSTRTSKRKAPLQRMHGFGVSPAA